MLECGCIKCDSCNEFSHYCPSCKEKRLDANYKKVNNLMNSLVITNHIKKIQNGEEKPTKSYYDLLKYNEGKQITISTINDLQEKMENMSIEWFKDIKSERRSRKRKNQISNRENSIIDEESYYHISQNDNSKLMKSDGILERTNKSICSKITKNNILKPPKGNFIELIVSSAKSNNLEQSGHFVDKKRSNINRLHDYCDENPSYEKRLS